MIITIDGPSGSGKSTVARKVAEALGFIYFDTGAMYRAVTYGLLTKGISIQDTQAIANFLKNFTLDLKVINSQKHYYWEGKDISEVIRGQEVTAKVSEVSALPIVREYLVKIQRELGSGKDSVFEGRDLGTVVFPQAEIKVYLFARPEVRAERRLAEFKRKDDAVDLKKVLDSINERDLYDSKREHSPLKPAADAHLLDTSDLTIDQVIDKILMIVQ